MYDSRDASGEPTLDDLLAEPVVRLMMARDHVNAEQIRGIVDSARLWAFAPQRGRDRSGRGSDPASTAWEAAFTPDRRHPISLEHW